MIPGSNVAKYIGQNLWKRIADDDAYKKGEYTTALKNSFLGCDADMKASELYSAVFCDYTFTHPSKIRTSTVIHQDVLR